MIDTVDMGQIAALWFAGIFIVCLVEMALNDKKYWPKILAGGQLNDDDDEDDCRGGVDIDENKFRVRFTLPPVTGFMFGTFVLYSVVFTSITAVQVLLTLF